MLKNWLAIVVVLIALPTAALAGDQHQTTLSRVAMDASGPTAYIWANGGWPVTLGGCDLIAPFTHPGLLAWNPTTDTGKALLSVALAAHLAGKTVIVYVSSSSGCNITVKRIDIL